MITKNQFDQLYEKSKSGVLSGDESKLLSRYKVDNAIIMAAGLSSRFAPLSFEKPKGLLVVKGEVLIERQINQLKEVGITDITVVVGYMKEQFYYLRDKFNVAVVDNDDYYRYNNTSTLIQILDKLSNTYICSSDNYFTSNVFEPYVYRSYYSAVYVDGKTNEWCIKTDDEDRIVEVSADGGSDSWVMLGHVYFSNDFSTKFKNILEREYTNKETKLNLWEKLYIRYIEYLPMYINKYEDSVIKEFDSLEELRDFDETYVNNTRSSIFANIRGVLKCEDKDIINIETIKAGLTNLSFHFDCLGEKYVYRHPGVGTEDYINRDSEAFSMEVAKSLGLDNTFIYMDNQSGWKLSRYIENIHTLDYHNPTEVHKALAMIKKLHDANIVSKYDTDTWQASLAFIETTKEYVSKQQSLGVAIYDDFTPLYLKMRTLHKIVDSDGVEKRLCHCDFYDPNLIVDPQGNINLIDWEYSGNSDPAQDLGVFICCSDYTFDEALEIFDIYYGRKPSELELRHCIAYVSIASYYWYVWAVFQNGVGNDVGDYLKLWHDVACTYADHALKLYK